MKKLENFDKKRKFEIFLKIKFLNFPPKFSKFPLSHFPALNKLLHPLPLLRLFHHVALLHSRHRRSLSRQSRYG